MNTSLYKGLIYRYQDFLPSSLRYSIVSLNEGRTPLIRLSHISNDLNLNVWAKYEGLNPTGSFKDRGMTTAVSQAVSEGVDHIICASTGNTSASAAAYAARAQIKSIVLIPDGKIAMGKLAQAMIYGAQVISIPGNFDQALSMVQIVAQKNKKISLVNSINPFRIEGQKTASFEIVDELKEVPDYHILPVGNAGNITAYWKGYKEYSTEKCPRMIGFQAQGANPIVQNKPIEFPQTLATAIRIGNPASWKQAVIASQESGGLISDVSDEEILKSQQVLASVEGIFVEPASAASLAGLIKLSQKSFFEKGSLIVLTFTGNGLKDPQIAIEHSTSIHRLDRNEDILDFLSL